MPTVGITMLKQQITEAQIESQLRCCPVARQAAISPNSLAIQTNNEQVNYAELHQRILNLTAQLIKLNMQKGDRLVCIAKNSMQLVLLQMTCVRNGFIFCPINPQFSNAEIEQRLAQLDSPFIWQANKASKLSLDFEPIHSKLSNHQQINIAPEAIVSIIFTSGSSGSPKAVMHNFSHHYYSALGSQSVIALHNGDSNLLSLPMFHISGYATVMRTLLAGATLQISDERINVGYLKHAQTTHLSLVSSQLQQLLNEQQFQATDLSIKHLLLGGSSFPKELLQASIERGFTYHLSYGSTEMASQIATSTNNEQLQLLPYRRLKIINNEIQLAGKTRFAGYFNGNSHNNLIDKKSYFPSSDLGKLNANIVTIIGRKDRQFISGGENIQPEEIEKVLLTFPEVAQAYVLPIDDAIFGQRPIAFIKWHHNEQSEQLIQFLQDKLIRFKQPTHYFILPEQQGIKINPKQLADSALKLLLIN